MKNSDWQDAEEARLLAESKYAVFMKSQEALNMREDHPEQYQHHIALLNAAIETANKRVRRTPQTIDE